MSAWLLLILAVIAEVSGTLSLRMATHGSRRWLLPMVFSYLVAFSSLATSLALGLPLGLAYGVWAACGVALTALLSWLLFKEPMSWVMSLGIVLIAGGVVLINTGAPA